MGKAWRWCLDNAGGLSVALGFLCLVLAAGQSPAVNPLLALAGLCLLQGLRNLWAASRAGAVLLAVVVPLLLVGLLASQGPRDPTVLLLLAPAALAAALEWGVQRWRVRHGLPAVPAPALPQPAPPRQPLSRRLGRGALLLAGLGLGFCGLAIYSIGQPARNARAFHATLRPGLSLGEVAIAAWPHGRYFTFVTASPEAPRVWLQPGAAGVGEEQARGEADVRALLDREAPRLGLVRVSFMFRGMAPSRSVVVVHFGPDGRMLRADAPANYAD